MALDSSVDLFCGSSCGSSLSIFLWILLSIFFRTISLASIDRQSRNPSLSAQIVCNDFEQQLSVICAEEAVMMLTS